MSNPWDNCESAWGGEIRLGRALKAFDDFIRQWVPPENHSHLLDNDNNAAERVRQAIRDCSTAHANLNRLCDCGRRYGDHPYVGECGMTD